MVRPKELMEYILQSSDAVILGNHWIPLDLYYSCVGSIIKDLYHRLNATDIQAPPLRDHSHDIPFLIQHFNQTVSRQEGLEPVKQITPDAMAEIMKYNWPGNVRELWNVLRKLSVKVREGEVHKDHVKKAIYNPTTSIMVNPRDRNRPSKEELLRVLQIHHWNLTSAARELGTHRNCVRRWISEDGLR